MVEVELSKLPKDVHPKHKAKRDELKSQSGEDLESAYSIRRKR
jgi:hypothetical protein